MGIIIWHFSSRYNRMGCSRPHSTTARNALAPKKYPLVDYFAPPRNKNPLPTFIDRNVIPTTPINCPRAFGWMPVGDSNEGDAQPHLTTATGLLKWLNKSQRHQSREKEKREPKYLLKTLGLQIFSINNLQKHVQRNSACIN